MTPRRPGPTSEAKAASSSEDRRCLVPPTLARTYARRERLNRWLRGPQPTTIVVTAPLWFGKTSLLRDWHLKLLAQGVSASWISGREYSAESPSLATLIAAHKTGHRRRSNRPSQADFPGAIFIDDAPQLPAAAKSELSHLLRVAPDTTLFVLSSRGELPTELSNAWTRGVTLEFTAADLAVDLGDAVLMANACGALPEVSSLQSLIDSTGGWAAAVRLMMDSHPGAQSVLERVLDEEVLRGLSKESQRFLESISILDRISIAACQAMTKHLDCESRMRSLVSSGAPLLASRDAEQNYQINPILRELLRRRLQARPGNLRQILHERASIWFARNGQTEEALHHSFESGHLALHAANLERLSEEMVYRGKIHLLERYATSLPASQLDEMPRLTMVLAWWKTRQYRFTEADELLEKSRLAEKRLTGRNRPTRTQTAELAALRRHRELTLRSARSAIPISDKECRKLLAAFEKTSNIGLQINLYAQLISSYRRQFRLREIFKLESQASALADRGGIITFTPWMRAELGAAQVEGARIVSARRSFERSLEDASRFSGVRLGLSALSGLYLADLCYESDDLGTAETLIDTHLQVAQEFGLVDQLVVGYGVQVRLHLAKGQVDQALRCLDEAIRFSDERQLDRLRRCLDGERVRLLTSIGSYTQLDEIAAQLKVGYDDVDARPDEKKVTDVEILDAARARILLSKGRHNEVLRLTNGWISHCTGNLAYRTLVRWQLIRTHALLVSGDVQSARRSLREALTHGARGHFLRKVAEAAAPVRQLLMDSYQSAPAHIGEVESFAKKVIALITRPNHEHSTTAGAHLPASNVSEGALSAREHEILLLVAGGLQNREIGNRLGITEGTVKWHMQQVFTKLGVRRRSQAVAILRAQIRS